MFGQMMQMPLMISSLIRHADRYHGDTQIVSRLTEGGIHRYTYTDAHRRARQLARALGSQGVRPGERIGTLAWNNHRHLEIYYAVSGMGAVCHTINPRLFPEQIAYIINHAEDSFVFFDISFTELIEDLAPRCPRVKCWLAMTDRDHLPPSALDLLSYEELVNAHSDDFEWPIFDENTAAALCYTSGTTGNPKGVLYSHRSTLLHAYAICLPDAFNLSSRETVLPVVSMFHVNGWGLPYAGPLAGCKLVLPGPRLDGAGLYELFEREQVTFSAGVPTIWMGLLEHLRTNGLTLSARPRILVGGAAAPPAMMKALAEEFGVTPRHAWGMTEMSPTGTVCSLKGKHLTLSEREKDELRAKQGRPLFGVEMEIVDEEGKPLPHDGKAFGELLVRGPWVCASYFRGEGGDFLRPGGWFATGDVATLDADGYMQITDRSKDVIKSGGEWISSIELENLAVEHPAVAEAAVVGVPHLKWDERPLLVVVTKKDAVLSRDDLMDFMRDKVAKWWLPDDVVFVDAIPHTATGKVLKTKLREDFRNHKLAVGLTHDGLMQPAPTRVRDLSPSAGYRCHPRHGAAQGLGYDRPVQTRATGATSEGHYEQLVRRQRAELQDAYLKGVRRLRWDAGRLAAERERRLRELLVCAADRSPFWQERLAGRDLANFTEADLPSLPVLTRAEMMAEFDRVVTVPGLTLARVQQHLDQSDDDRGYLDDEYQAIITSGYIGTQAVHVYGWDAFITFVMQGSRWTGRRGEDPDAVLAQAFAISTRHESGIFHAFSTFESGGPASHCSGGTQPLDEIVDGLNSARPAVQALQAWPSLMRELALEAIAGRLTIKPTWVSVAGEVCTPPVREAVRSAWGIETSEFWGCSEGTYAFPCGVGEGMHVADDLVILEPADADGNVVPYGQPAERLLLTNLFNLAQPLIRYDLVDAVTMTDEPCPCGCAHRRITAVNGRIDGAFQYDSGAAVPRAALEQTVLATPGVANFFVGKTQGGVDVSVVTDGSCDLQHLRTELINVLRRHGGPESDVGVQEVDSIDRLWSGKSKQFDAG